MKPFKCLAVTMIILAAACLPAAAASRSGKSTTPDRAAGGSGSSGSPASVGDPFYPFVSDNTDSDLGLNPHTATCVYAPWHTMQHHDEQKFIKVTITSPTALPKGTKLIIELPSGEKWTQTLPFEFPAGLGFFYIFAPDTIPLEGFGCEIALKAPSKAD